MKSKLLTALTLALSLALAQPTPAQAEDTKTVILLESDSAAPSQCETSNAKQTQQCVDTWKLGSSTLQNNVLVEMRLDPDCEGMIFVNNLIDVGHFEKDADYINAVVTYMPKTNENVWWLNIVTINGKDGPDPMSGKAANAKEIAHKLCYIIHQEKITR